MGDDWVAVDVWTLPTAKQPLRVAEFDALFERNLVTIVRSVRCDAASPDPCTADPN
jgi:hypothetical protein